MRTLLTIIGKDLRLLWRDKPALIFLMIAPFVVITVAGFSLANLYGADPTGQTGFELPLVDEDGGALGRTVREQLGHQAAVNLRMVDSREAAAARVRDKYAGTALVIPSGTDAALERGAPAELILYTDPVKYFERLNIRLLLLELSQQVATRQREAAADRARSELERLRSDAERLQGVLDDAHTQLDAAYEQARRARAETMARVDAGLARARRDIEEQVQRAAAAAEAETRGALEQQMRELRAPMRLYLETLQARRADFERWLTDLKRQAGSHAGDIPPPPSFPEIPAAVQQLVDGTVTLQLPTPRPIHLTIVPPKLELAPVPSPPIITLPALVLPAPPVAGGALTITETNLTGGPLHINTFDQNVPGFSVTFLLLGMLLGVSLGLLDERDWGTFDRVRTLPIAPAQVLIGKLLSRFVVGVAQMTLLLAVGWVAFGISLGPQPWALLLPIMGIVLAGCAFGLVVAAVAPSRESVLPVGSIVIVTMAAVGGCWWPIDLEPRWMRTVALAFPTTWAMDAFNDLMIRRRSIDAALRPTAVMLAYAGAYLLVGVALFRRRVT